MRILLGLAVAPILANQASTEAVNSGSENKGVTAQDNSSKPSPTIRDLFFHPKDVGQSSTLGQRLLTPDQIQSITPEELAERERRKKMADAGVEAGFQGANAIGNILPTAGPEEMVPQIIISEGVERIVDAKTTAPKQTSAPETKGADSKKPSAQAENTADSGPRTQPDPYYPVRQRFIGGTLNPKYLGPFDGDPASTEKPRFWPTGPQPKPSTTEGPKKKVSIKIELVPDKKTDLEPQKVQLKARGLVR